LVGARNGRYVLTFIAALGVSACGDAGSPLDAGSVERQGTETAFTAVSVTGRYETRASLVLGESERVYLVGVYFGAATQADGRTYLAQVGVEGASGTRLLMEQKSYTKAGDSIEFAVLLERGTFREDGRKLDVDVMVDGKRFSVTLTRI
jgi:hypothetical protein